MEASTTNSCPPIDSFDSTLKLCIIISHLLIQNTDRKKPATDEANKEPSDLASMLRARYPAPPKLTNSDHSIQAKVRAATGGGSSSTPYDHMRDLEVSIEAKTRATVGDKKPSARNLTHLEQSLSEKVRASSGRSREKLAAIEGKFFAHGTKKSPPAAGTPPGLNSLEASIAAKTRASSATGIPTNLSNLEEAIAAKTRQTMSTSTVSALDSLEDSIRAKHNGSRSGRFKAQTPAQNKKIESGTKMERLDEDTASKWGLDGDQVVGAKQENELSAVSDKSASPIDLLSAKQSDIERGNSLGLAVAIAVEDEDDEEYIPAAIEYDPDAKPPLFRNRRFRLYASLIMCALLCIVIGGTVGLLLSRSEEEFVPSAAPTIPRQNIGIEEVVERIAGEQELQDPDSPYTRAMNWMIFDDPLEKTPDDPTFIQRFLLVYFYYATTVDGPWLSCNPPQGNETSTCQFAQLVAPPDGFTYVEWVRWLSDADECQWAGINCDEQGKVRGLDLAAANLSGPFPTGITNLDTLHALSLTWSALRGDLPSDVAKLNHLFSIELAYNEFSGSIPTTWWSARNLVRVNVGGNMLTGPIPSEVSQLRDMKGLFVFDNLLTGNLPDSIFDVGRLGYLRIHRNLMTGQIPTLFSKLTNLEEIYAFRNEFNGSLPDVWGNSNIIRDFRFHNNQLTGHLPPSLWEIGEQLNRIDLFDNNFTGTISPDIVKLSGLSVLRISSNSFTGGLPLSLGNMTMLSQLEIDNNNFNGKIPSLIGNMTSLGVFSAHNNDLTGDMPSEVCTQLPNLASLSADCFSEINCTCCNLCCDREGQCGPPLPPPGTAGGDAVAGFDGN